MNCGVTAHEDECLCDVRVGEPTPINFSINQVLGSEFLDDDRWSHPWDASKVADYAETLLAAYDEWRERSANPAFRDGHARRLRDRAAFQAEVRELLRSGESIVDVPAILGITFDEMWEALRHARSPFYETWGDLDWLKFESALESFPPGVFNTYQLASRLGMPRREVQLRKMVLGQLAESLYGRRQVSAAEVKKLTSANDA